MDGWIDRQTDTQTDRQTGSQKRNCSHALLAWDWFIPLQRVRTADYRAVLLT